MIGQKHQSNLALKASAVAFAATTILSSIPSAQGQYYSATYYPSPSGLPKTTENGQTGTNDCGTGSSQTSQCQNFYLNSVEDFCVWAPPNGGEVAQFEENEVSYCTQPGRGTRLIPAGTIQGAHFIKTPSYVQITGTGDFTKIGITAGDQGGELDPHGATGNGNPIGGLMFYQGQQMHEWFSFMSATQFCTRACFDGPRATSLCRHTYDELGCDFNAPGNYNPGFEECQGNDAQDIMYGYPGQATFVQSDTSYGVQVPSPHPAPASYNCQSTSGIVQSSVGYYAASSSKSSSSSSSTSTSSSSSSSSSTSSTSTSTSTSSTSTSSSTTTSISTSTSFVMASPTSATITTGQQNKSNENGANNIHLNNGLLQSFIAMTFGAVAAVFL